MIKLNKKELQILEETCQLFTKLYRTCTEEEKNSLNVASTLLGIDGIILYQSNMNKKMKGCE